MRLGGAGKGRAIPADSAAERKESKETDQAKVEDAVLAVLWLTLHDECCVWKTIDWDTMDQLHTKRYISDPARRAKSVVFTEEGLSKAKRLAEAMFT
jgi:hypothetical protein